MGHIGKKLGGRGLDGAHSDMPSLTHERDSHSWSLYLTPGASVSLLEPLSHSWSLGLTLGASVSLLEPLSHALTPIFQVFEQFSHLIQQLRLCSAWFWVWLQRVIYAGCGLGEASMSSTSVLAVKRMERRKRGMESVRDIEDDVGPVFKRSRLAGAATYGMVMVFGL